MINFNSYDPAIIDGHYLQIYGFFEKDLEQCEAMGYLVIDVNDIKYIWYVDDNITDNFRAQDFDVSTKIVLSNGDIYWTGIDREGFEDIYKAFIKAKNNFRTATRNEAFELLMTNKLIQQS